MKSYIKSIFAALVILSSNNIILGKIPSLEEEYYNVTKGRKERKIQRALSEKLISWLSDANESAGVECDKLADSLLSLKEPGVSSYFVAAQIAWLREKSEKAIAILEDVINKYPDQMAPTMHVPVKIVGRFWIGTIARQAGDIAKAKNVYEIILKMLESPENIEGLDDKGGVVMICNLYLAEIESLHLKRNDLALTRLEAIERVKKPDGQLGAGYDIYKGWAIYRRIEISKGKAQGTQQLIAYPEIMDAPLLAVSQLSISGITGDPLIGCCSGPDRQVDIVIDTFINRAVKKTISPIDWSLVTLMYGVGNQVEGQRAQKENLHPEAENHYLEAEKYYSALFEEDSFFSPVAGIYLAKCKKEQRKTAEADNLLEQVKAKYPGYESAVTELKESWKKETP